MVPLMRLRTNSSLGATSGSTHQSMDANHSHGAASHKSMYCATDQGNLLYLTAATKPALSRHIFKPRAWRNGPLLKPYQVGIPIASLRHLENAFALSKTVASRSRAV